MVKPFAQNATTTPMSLIGMGIKRAKGEVKIMKVFVCFYYEDDSIYKETRVVIANTKSEALGLVLNSDSSHNKDDWAINEIQFEREAVYDEHGNEITKDLGI